MYVRGPLTFVDDGEWRLHAACRHLDVTLFFPEYGHRIDKARTICGHCPVKDICLEQGIVNQELGVWGGTSEEERVVIIRARRREGRLAARPKPQPPCGTLPGWRWHVKHGGYGSICDRCREARRQSYKPH